MPGDRIPHSVLPPAEIGTAQQEIPVDQVYVLMGSVICDYDQGDTWVQDVYADEASAYRYRAILETEQLQRAIDLLKSDAHANITISNRWSVRAHKLIR
jgi:hypothetical protein